MAHRTLVVSTFHEYLTSEYPETSGSAIASREADLEERRVRLKAFPHALVLQIAYAELDFANRWCWQQFGPADGECHQASSEYAACELRNPHRHDGTWLTQWLAKTEYNFGFNEWCFAKPEDRDRFLQFLPEISWGEKYPD